jgi:hypothetical protein
MSTTTATNITDPLRVSTFVPARQCVCCVRRHSKPVRFKIDGKFYCARHADRFWSDHFVEEHTVLRF